MNWYLRALRKYAVFSGRARRKEFWWFTGMNIVVWIGVQELEVLVGGITIVDNVFIVTWLYVVGTILPTIAVGVRRLHDTGRSGMRYLLALVPLLNLILLWDFTEKSEAGDNEYGPNPIDAPA